jgi:hypothetical protein
MAPRKNNEPASWEVDADKPKPEGETRARRAYCVKDLTLRKCQRPLMTLASTLWGESEGERCAQIGDYQGTRVCVPA